MTNLEVHAGHLRVYKAIARQAEEFWNQLALYLPITRGSRVHKLIELVHQTLLQGIADLDQVAILANEEERKIEWAANDLEDQCDRMFTERPPTPLPKAPSIRSSLTETGYFDRAARQAERIHKNAEQVQRSYRALLDGIARAFDERRVRGTDVLQRVGFVFALLVGVFAFLPEALNAIFTNWGQGSQGQLVRLSRIGVAGFLLSGVGVYLWRRWLGTLGSRLFRRRHGQIREFLADCASDRLTRLRDYGWKQAHQALDDPSMDEARAWNKFFATWDKLDWTLAYQCAEILDALARDEFRQPTWSAGRPRLEDLDRQVERWALKALLMSERPREFRQFVLPRLTFLYRFCPMMEGELLSNSIETTEASIVSDSDFRFTVVNQCSGRPDEIDEIERWAQDQVNRATSSMRFVKALNEVGLKAGMTREDFRAMLERMREQLAPETPAGDLVSR